MSKKKHFIKRKVFGQTVVEMRTNAPMNERLTTAKGTITFRDKSKYNRATERRANKAR